LRAALLQLTSSDDPETNLGETAGLIARAAAEGADFVLTPEVTNCLSASRTRQNEVLCLEADDPTLAALRDAAASHGIHLLIGSLALKAPRGDDERFVNRSFLIGPDGAVRARYDKIHMFDVKVSETETYRESDGYRPGDEAVVADVDGLRVGLTICYDVRFPHLYRALAHDGAQVITVPSAFSPVTGAAHWETLLRARAIETGAYVLAPAQTGQHVASRGRARETYGHSLAVDPWGVVLADGGTAPGVTVVELDPHLVTDCRSRVPSLSHDRVYSKPQ
jgi:predicted amidohydrolase